MLTVEAAVWLALKQRIDTLTTDPAMTAYEPGEIIVPASDDYGPLPYILLGDARNEGERVGISNPVNIISGTALLTIQWPIARAVTHTQLMQIGGTIAAHFPADQRMRVGATTVRLTRDADVLQPTIEGAIRSVPVRVPWSTT